MNRRIGTGTIINSTVSRHRSSSSTHKRGRSRFPERRTTIRLRSSQPFRHRFNHEHRLHLNRHNIRNNHSSSGTIREEMITALQTITSSSNKPLPVHNRIDNPSTQSTPAPETTVRTQRTIKTLSAQRTMCGRLFMRR